MDQKKQTILIVDDEADICEILAFDLQRAGFTVLTASNGKKAFDLVNSDHVDAVLSDIRMPGGDGVELLENIRTRNPEIPVVSFMTGYADLTVEEALDRGVEALLLKPFDRKTLINTVLKSLTPLRNKWKTKPAEKPGLAIEKSLPSLVAAQKSKAFSLGRGGFYVALETPPSVGGTVSFKITLDDERLAKLEGLGVVRWRRDKPSAEYPVGCGVEFTYVDDAVRTAVADFIGNLKPRAFVPKV